MEKEEYKVLFLASNLPNMPNEEFVKEYRKLQQMLEINQQKFRTVQKFAFTIDMIQDAILTEKPNIIHFSGHGAINSETEIEESYRAILLDKKTGIIVMNDEGNPKVIKTKAIANMFKLFTEDDEFNIQAVILSACYEEEQAKAISNYVPYVIGMKNTILHKTTIEFTRGFYRGLSHNKDLFFCYELGKSKVELEDTNEEDSIFIHTKGLQHDRNDTVVYKYNETNN